MKPISTNRVLAELTRAQLHGAGKFFVEVEVTTKDGKVLRIPVNSATFDANSGNVNLTAKE